MRALASYQCITGDTIIYVGLHSVVGYIILVPRCFSPSIMFFQFEEVERTGPLNQ